MRGKAAGIILFTLAVLSGAVVSDGQQPTKVARIGILGNTDSPGWEAFRRGLRELGYVEGQNVAIEWRWAKAQFERLPDLAAEKVRLKVDQIDVWGWQAFIEHRVIGARVLPSLCHPLLIHRRQRGDKLVEGADKFRDPGAIDGAQGGIRLDLSDLSG